MKIQTENTSVRHWGVSFLLCASLLLAGCPFDSDDNDDDDTIEPPPPPTAISKTFTIEVINLTNFQPLAPIAGVLHTSERSFFNIGETASEALEQLAEGGDNSLILAETGDDILGNGTSEGITGPGATATFDVSGETEDGTGFYLTVLTMPVNTNDAFTGTNSLSLDALEVGESIQRNTRTYDAGTEANTEASGTIPGPADGGEGFNAARDDINFITMHPGVVTSSDGLSTSILTEQHRFDNPTTRVIVTRTQ